MIDINIQLDNFERVHGKLHRFPRRVDESLRQSLRDFYLQDFRPMLNRIVRGFKAPNVPAQNAPKWADYKAKRWGIRHSLGVLTGKLHQGVMAVKPVIRTVSNRTHLEARFDQIPKAGYPYLPVVHGGLNGLWKSYPFVEGARMMTHDSMMRRIEAGLSGAWNRS